MTYNSRVLIGNWYEDVQLQDDMMKEFLERRDKGGLLIQRMGTLLNSASQTFTMSPSPGGNLTIGAVVQLVNASPPTSRTASAADQRKPAVLAINPPEDLLHSSSGLSNAAGAAGSTNTTPTLRNLFKIKSVDGSPDGTTVTYGMNFLISSLDGLGQPLYMQSDVVGFDNAAKKSRHQGVSFTSDNGFRAHWRIECFNPQERFENQGFEVKTDERVVLIHQKTGHPLALEEMHMFRNFFGREYEITTHLYLNDHRAEMNANHWIFSSKPI